MFKLVLVSLCAKLRCPQQLKLVAYQTKLSDSKSSSVSPATVLDINILPENICGKLLAARAAATLVVENQAPATAIAAVQVPARGDLTELFQQPEFSYENAIADFKRQLVRTALRECTPLAPCRRNVENRVKHIA